MIRKFEAKDGYVWKSKKEGWIGSNVLYLGVHDNIENYEQVPEPIEIEPEEENISEETA